MENAGVSIVSVARGYAGAQPMTPACVVDLLACWATAERHAGQTHAYSAAAMHAYCAPARTTQLRLQEMDGGALQQEILQRPAPAL
jgi:hypothetical protein